MSKLTALIGIARSGKSTFAKNWQMEDDPDGLKRVVVNGDNVRTALHGMRYVHSAEPIVHGIYSTMVRALLLNPNLHILMDDTHTTVGSIKAVLNMDINAEFIYIPCSIKVVKQRAVDTNQKDLFPVINRMHNNLRSLCWHSVEEWEDVPDGIDHRADARDFDPNAHRINKTIELIRNEVRKVKEYSDRSV